MRQTVNQLIEFCRALRCPTNTGLELERDREMLLLFFQRTNLAWLRARQHEFYLSVLVQKFEPGRAASRRAERSHAALQAFAGVSRRLAVCVQRPS